VSVGGSFEIDGNDWTPDASSGSCTPVFGISVSSALPGTAPGANEAAVEGGLAGDPLTHVKGKPQDPARSAAGANTVAPDAELTPSRVQLFVDAARSADLVLEHTDPGGLSFSDIGACASNWSSSACWGTRDRPKVVYVKGNPDPASAISALQISGNARGYGILIVEDGEVWISGTFRWHGLIIVTGSRVAGGFLGGGGQIVYGSVIFNDMSHEPGQGKGFLTGNARLRYSCQALDQARLARKLVTLRSWKEIAQ